MDIYKEIALASDDVVFHVFVGQVAIGLLAFLLPDFAKLKGVVRMVATQFQQGHVLRSIQDAGRLGKLLGQDNFAFNVVDFVAIVLSHGSVLPFCCSKL